MIGGATSQRACVVPRYLACYVKPDCGMGFSNCDGLPSSLSLLLARSDMIRSLAKLLALGRPGLNIDNVRHLPLPLPPLRRTATVIAEVDRRLPFVDKAEDPDHCQPQTLRPPPPKHPQAGLRGQAGPARSERRAGERAAGADQDGEAQRSPQWRATKRSQTFVSKESSLVGGIPHVKSLHKFRSLRSA